MAGRERVAESPTDDLRRDFCSEFAEPNCGPRGGRGKAGWYSCDGCDKDSSSYKSEGSSFLIM